MRRRDPRAALADARDAANAIREFTARRSFEDFENDSILAAAVERKFEILGEALSRLLAIDPSLESALPDARKAIGMRNTLAHGYDDVDPHTVWSTAIEDIPAMASAIARTLDELEKM